MNGLPVQQKGASAIATLIILVLLGYGVYLGIQYAPLMIESKSIDSMLGNVQDAHKKEPIESVEEANVRVIGLLQINEMNDMTESFRVSQNSEGIIIEFSYDRELNLVYKKKPMLYRKTLILK